MRYKITLKETDHDYTAIVYRDYDEPSYPQDASSIAQRKLFSILQAYQNLEGEIRDSKSYSVETIEEVPSLG